ncbi:hypothetical protein HZA56_05315 [Candidatus Poribacteria bacterium]|nr:hypothetical protein [Candidatus Poribacteria bacterium]
MRTRATIFFAIAFIQFGVFSDLATCYAQEVGQPPSTACQAASQTHETQGLTDWRQIADKIKLVRLFSVVDGKTQESVFTKESLKTKEKLIVKGHVRGMIIFLEEDMVVSVDGHGMSKIRRNADGTVTLRYFGNMKTEEVVDAGFSEDHARESGSSSEPPAEEEFLPACYSIFPTVTGDAISQKSEFLVAFESEGKTYTAPVQQESYRALRTIRFDTGRRRDSVTFRYLGTRLESLECQSAEFEKRLNAIAEGVDSVESLFDVDLVENVNIIDFENVRNAVACEDEKDIWFYIEAFQKEPFAELKTIAAHEAIHIYVDKSRFAKDTDVRDLFADLKEYDDFSYERFMITMTGVAPAGSPEKSCQDCPFFAFINESNFIDGMKGGHSHRSIEEFCVSFMHSLMFVDRLEQILDRPVRFPGLSGQTRLLTPQEKSAVLDSYVATLEVLLSATSQNEATATTKNFLQKSLDRTLEIQAKRRH